jgi:hypothetical protein
MTQCYRPEKWHGNLFRQLKTRYTTPRSCEKSYSTDGCRGLNGLKRE